MLVLDTLRADHLGTYGYPIKSSPKLDEFAETSTVYTNAFSSAPWTVPAHASMFTGLYSFEHGARTFEVDKVIDNVAPLSGYHITLAEVFQDMGYETGAMGANWSYLFNARYGLYQGFKTFKYVEPDIQDVNKLVIPWLQENKDRPFFLFVNYMDTHRIYNIAPRPGLLERPVNPDATTPLDELIQKAMGEERPPPPELVQTVVDQYDTAVANLDEGLGDLFSELKELSLFDDSLILVTSDHGEYFGEHGLVEHSKDVYQEVLHVPLIVKKPLQEKGTTDETPVSMVDIPDIIFSGTGLSKTIERRYPGVFPYTLGTHPIIAENYYTRLHDLFNPKWGKRFRRVRRAFFEKPYKYIWSSDGNHELYDLKEDPVEMNNLAHEEREKAQEMAAKLQKFLDSREWFEPVKKARPVTEREKEILRALGYL